MFEDTPSKYGMKSIIAEAKSKASFLIEGLVRAEDTVIIGGLPKVGKSWLSAQLAYALSENVSFLDFRPSRKYRILYFDFEMSAGYSAQRFLEFFEDENAASRNADLHRCADFDHIDILSEPDHTALANVIAQVQPEVIIFDTLSKMHFEDENSNVLMTKVLTAIKRLCKGRTSFIVHHVNKTQSYGKQGASQIRGAGAILASSDAALVLSEPSKKKFVITCTTRHSPVEDIYLERSGPRFVRVVKTDGRRKRTAPDELLFSLFLDSVSLSSKEVWERYRLTQPETSQKTIQRGLGRLVDAGLLLKQTVRRVQLFSRADMAQERG